MRILPIAALLSASALIAVPAANAIDIGADLGLGIDLVIGAEGNGGGSSNEGGSLDLGLDADVNADVETDEGNSSDEGSLDVNVDAGVDANVDGQAESDSDSSGELAVDTSVDSMISFEGDNGEMSEVDISTMINATVWTEDGIEIGQVEDTQTASNGETVFIINLNADYVEGADRVAVRESSAVATQLGLRISTTDEDLRASLMANLSAATEVEAEGEGN